MCIIIIIIIYPGHLSLDVASQCVAIHDRQISMGRSKSYQQLSSRYYQRTLLIKLILNIHCKSMKNNKVFGDGGWDLGCRMEVNMRSYCKGSTSKYWWWHGNPLG